MLRCLVWSGIHSFCQMFHGQRRCPIVCQAPLWTKHESRRLRWSFGSLLVVSWWCCLSLVVPRWCLAGGLLVVSQWCVADVVLDCCRGVPLLLWTFIKNWHAKNSETLLLGLDPPKVILMQSIQAQHRFLCLTATGGRRLCAVKNKIPKKNVSNAHQIQEYESSRFA